MMNELFIGKSERREFMKKRSSLATVFLSLTFLFVFPSVAQQREANKIAAPQNLVLEVTYFKGRPVAGHTLAADGKSGGAWYALFQTNPEFKMPAGALPVRAVNIASRMEGSTAKVRVSVFVGEKFHDKEEYVADYSINENEKVSVKELVKFGVVPFELAVVKKSPTVAVLPDVVNTSNWLKVSVEPNYSTLPTFRLLVTNTSGKAVETFKFATSIGNRPMVSAMPRDLQDFPLIAPGATYETIIALNLDAVRELAPDAFDSSANPKITIKDVIFADGSYESSASDAAAYFALKLGTKSFLEKVIPLMEKVSTESAGSSVDRLIEQISLLKETVDEASLDELVNKFPMLGADAKYGLRSSALSGFRVNRIKLVTEMKKLQETGARLTFDSSEESVTQQFRGRLKRLSK